MIFDTHAQYRTSNIMNISNKSITLPISVRTAACSTKPQMIPIRVKSIHPVVRWNFTSHNQECYICRMALDDTCPNCVEHTTCKSVILKCCHGYHYHCIEKWSRTSNKCPVDQQTIEYLKKDSVDLTIEK